MSKSFDGVPVYDVPVKNAPRDNKAILEDDQLYKQVDYTPQSNNNIGITDIYKEIQARNSLLIQKQAEELMDEQENPFDRWDEAEKTPEYLELCADYTHSALDKYNEFKDSPEFSKEADTLRRYTRDCHNKISDYLDEKYPGWYYNDEDKAKQAVEDKFSKYDSPRYNMWKAGEKDKYNPDYQYETGDDCKDFVNKFRKQEYSDYEHINDFELPKERLQKGTELFKNSNDDEFMKNIKQDYDSEQSKKYDDNLSKEIEDEQATADEVSEKHQKSLQKEKQFDAEDSKNKEIDKALTNGNNLLEQEQKAKSLNVYSKPDLNGYYDNFYKNGPESYANDLASDIAGATVGDAGNTFANGMVAEAGAPTPQKIGTIEVQPARNEDLQFENEKQNQSIAEMHGRQAMDQMSSNNASKYAEMLMAKYEADNKQYEATQQAYKDAGLDGPKLPGSKYTG